MKTLGAMFLVIVLALSDMFYIWLIEIQGENEGMHLAKQFMSELTDELFD